MIEIEEGSVLLTSDEYEELSNPCKCYTFLTKTKAKKLVERILRKEKAVCWNNTDEGYEDGCCSSCPVYTILGDDAADVICERDKRWSK